MRSLQKFSIELIENVVVIVAEIVGIEDYRMSRRCRQVGLGIG